MADAAPFKSPYSADFIARLNGEDAPVESSMVQPDDLIAGPTKDIVEALVKHGGTAALKALKVPAELLQELVGKEAKNTTLKGIEDALAFKSARTPVKYMPGAYSVPAQAAGAMTDAEFNRALGLPEELGALAGHPALESAAADTQRLAKLQSQVTPTVAPMSAAARNAETAVAAVQPRSPIEAAMAAVKDRHALNINMLEKLQQHLKGS